MANKVTLITLKDLKKKSIIDGNLDGDKIVQFIEVAQDTYIQPRLGTKLYEALMELVFSNDIDLAENSNYKLLHTEYVKPMLVWYAQAIYMDFAPYKIANGGVYKHTSENADLPAETELASIKASMIEYAEFYVKRFEDYMCYNKDLFDEYDDNEDEDMRPENRVNFSNWVL